MMVVLSHTKRLVTCLQTLLVTLDAYQVQVKEQMMMKRNKNKIRRRKGSPRKVKNRLKS